MSELYTLDTTKYPLSVTVAKAANPWGSGFVSVPTVMPTISLTYKIASHGFTVFCKITLSQKYKRPNNDIWSDESERRRRQDNA